MTKEQSQPSEYMQFLQRNTEIINSWPKWKRELWPGLKPTEIEQPQPKGGAMLPAQITIELSKVEAREMLLASVKQKLAAEGVHCDTSKAQVCFNIVANVDRTDSYLDGVKITVTLAPRPRSSGSGDKF